jgi:hypothetical protein
MQSSASTSTSGRPPKAPQQQQQQQPAQRVSVSPPTSSLGTPYVDLYTDAFGQPPADILPPSAQPPAQSFAYAHLPTHSDELARVHVFQTAEPWLPPHAHRHQQPHAQQQQHAAHVRAPPAPPPPPMYAAHQPASYGASPNPDTFSAYALLDASTSAAGAAQGQQQGQQQDGGVDMWQTMPTGYEFVFPFTPPSVSGHHGSAGGQFVAGAAVGQLEMMMIG